MLTSLVAFIGAACLIAVVPGPSTVVILRRSVINGRASGVATVLGNETGVLFWGLAAAFGLSALLLASRVAFDAMRIAGAVLLVGMGARALWKARHTVAAEPAPDEPTAEPAMSHWRAYRLGVLTNFANPKAGVFAISFLPQFVPHDAPVAPTLVLFSVVWALIDMAWYLPMVWLAGRARKVFRRPAVQRRLEQVTGVVLVGLGLRLALES
jgi:threonine/homoserine/homoserine lactone efflux protein